MKYLFILYIFESTIYSPIHLVLVFQIDSFLEGFHELVPPELISIFDAQELELLISGLPDIDLDDLRAHTEYHSYKPSDPEISYFWNVLKSFSKQEKALFLQFVPGTSKVLSLHVSHAFFLLRSVACKSLLNFFFHF